MAELDNLEIVITSSSSDAVNHVNDISDAMERLSNTEGTATNKAKKLQDAIKKVKQPELSVSVDTKDMPKAVRTFDKLKEVMEEASTDANNRLKESMAGIEMPGEMNLDMKTENLNLALDQKFTDAIEASTEKINKNMSDAFDSGRVQEFSKEVSAVADKKIDLGVDNIAEKQRRKIDWGPGVSAASIIDEREAKIPKQKRIQDIKSTVPQVIDDALADRLIQDSKLIDILGMKADGTREKLVAALSDPEAKTDSIARMIEQIQNLQNKISSVSTGDLDSKFLSTASKSELLTKKLEILKSKLEQAFDQGAFPEKLLQIQMQINSVSEQIDKLGQEADKVSIKWPKLLKSIGRITFYRLVRAAIKSVTDAMSEGLQNAYAFSQGVGDRMATALDSMSSASLKMKNQLGAAFGSLLTAVTPILMRIMSLVTTVANAITQLFAAITGGTYLKAKDVTAQFVESTAAGAAAAEEWKNQLMGFDEINRLEEPSDGAGGGGGGSLLDPSEMFEVAEISEKVKNLVQFVKEHLPEILTLATLIGLAIAAWKIGDFINQLSALPNIFLKIIGFISIIAGVFLYAASASDAWVNGVDWGNFAGMLAGTALIVGGLAVVLGTTAAAIGLLIAGIGMLVIGLHDWIATGELSNQTFALMEVGILAVGIALSALISPWALVVAAIGAAALAIYKYWDDIKATLNSMIAGIELFVNRVIGSINALLGGVNSVAQAFGFNANIQIGYVSIPRFADGGYPIAGSLMIAGEAGAEMVGSINGKTGVASNQEITGIADAVYTVGSWILQAMREEDRTTKVYLDKRQIAEAVSQSQRQTARATGG